MIGYMTDGTRKRHVMAQDVGDVIRRVVGVLETCTDCKAPASREGVPPDKAKLLRPRPGGRPGALPPLCDLVDELVRDDQPYLIELGFDFALRIPNTTDLLPYAEPKGARRLSSLFLELVHRKPSRVSLTLWWPFDEVTELFLRSHDAIFEGLGLAPFTTCWYRGSAGDDQESIELDPAAFAPPPSDAVGLRLHEQVLANPRDAGARVAYADWLTGGGDPLGEVMVLQVELATLPTNDPRSIRMRARVKELIERHGLRWSRVLVRR